MEEIKTYTGIYSSCSEEGIESNDYVLLMECRLLCDLAVYEIAYALRKEYPDEFSNLGGFYLCHNFIHAIHRIMRGSGAENMLTAGGVCLEGTSQKLFGEGGQYYQSLHAMIILSEVVSNMHWEAFEEWCISEHKDTSCMSEMTTYMEKRVKTVLLSGDVSLSVNSDNQNQNCPS